MARALAICKGGPLDGQCFSVLLDEQGSPPPLESRAEVVGVLYVPSGPAELTEAVGGQFHELFGHESAFEYVAEPAT